MHRAKANIVLTQKAGFRLHCFPTTLDPKQPPDTTIAVVLFKLITVDCDCATNESYFSNGEEAVSQDA